MLQLVPCSKKLVDLLDMRLDYGAPASELSRAVEVAKAAKDLLSLEPARVLDGRVAVAETVLEDAQAAARRLEERTALNLPEHIALPTEFFCPIGKEVMHNPVTAAGARAEALVFAQGCAF